MTEWAALVQLWALAPLALPWRPPDPARTLGLLSRWCSLTPEAVLKSQQGPGPCPLLCALVHLWSSALLAAKGTSHHQGCRWPPT